MPTPPVYALDLTGTLTANKIINEVHPITDQTDQMFVPSGGPFYTTGLILTNSITGALLRPTVDYWALQLDVDAVYMSGKEVCGIIYIANSAVTSVTMSYQVIGGMFSDTVSQLMALLAANPQLPTAVLWGNLISVPDQFPPSMHTHTGLDIVNMNMFVAAIFEMQQQIAVGDGPSFNALYQYIRHYCDYAIQNAGTGDVAAEIVNRIQADDSIQTQVTGISTLLTTAGIIGRLVNILNATPSLKGTLATALVSSHAGNQVVADASGIYLGTVAPENVTHVYVKADTGNDTTAAGTQTRPFKTLGAALAFGPPGVYRNIYLYEGLIYDVYNNAAGVLPNSSPAVVRGGHLNVYTYGPLTDALPYRRGDSRCAQLACVNLGTTIRANASATPDATGFVYAWMASFYPISGASVITTGISYIAATLPAGSNISSGSGMLQDYTESGSFWVRYANVNLPENNSGTLVSGMAPAPYSLTLEMVELNGAGQLVRYPGPGFTLGVSADRTVAPATVRSYIRGASIYSGLYTGFTTNVIPYVPSQAGQFNVQGASYAHGSGQQIVMQHTFRASDAHYLIDLLVSCNFAGSIGQSQHFSHIVQITGGVNGTATVAEHMSGSLSLPLVYYVYPDETPTVTVYSTYLGTSTNSDARSCKVKWSCTVAPA